MGKLMFWGDLQWQRANYLHDDYIWWDNLVNEYGHSLGAKLLKGLVL